jgi:hypothetical protein
MGFWSLQHMKDRRSTCRGLRLPATFRLQGLATLLAVSSLRSRAGFVSHRQRSWDSPFGGFPSQKVSGVLPPGGTHIPLFLAVLPPPERRAGPTGLGFWVSTLPRVPGDRQVFSPPTAGSSLGFRPSRVLRRRPRSGFRPISSHALCHSGSHPPDQPAPQSIDQPPLGIVRAPHRGTAGQRDPLRVFAPALNPEHSSADPPGL